MKDSHDYGVRLTVTLVAFRCWKFVNRLICTSRRLSLPWTVRLFLLEIPLPVNCIVHFPGLPNIGYKLPGFGKRDFHAFPSPFVHIGLSRVIGSQGKIDVALVLPDEVLEIVGAVFDIALRVKKRVRT